MRVPLSGEVISLQQSSRKMYCLTKFAPELVPHKTILSLLKPRLPALCTT